MPLEGVPDCCSGARRRRQPRRHGYGGLEGRPGACHAGATASPSHGSSPSERLPTAGSHRSRTAHIGRVRRCLWKACRTVAQALEDEGNRDATDTEVSKGAQERATPEPQPHQAAGAAQVSVFPPLAHASHRARRAGVLLRRSRTKATVTPRIRRAPRSVPRRSHSLTKPREQPE